jgi:hypothetical protein
MTQNSMKFLMATTVLAGFAIFALDAAQAGPNGGPSLGSISGFSSMRMDFNRVGGPNRALSRDDTRVVPLVVKKTEKSKDTKNTVKKGTDIARVLNPKPASGGKGKDVASAPAVRIPAPLAEIYRVTGGNLDDISQLAELASWLKTGLPVAGNPFLPQQGDAPFALPEDFGQGGRQPSGGDKSESRYWGLNGWFGTSGAPGGADSSKTGWAAGDAWRTTRQGPTNTGHFVEEYNKQENRYRVTYFDDGSMMYRRDDYAPGRGGASMGLPASRTWIWLEVGTDGTVRMVGETHYKEGAESAGGDGKATGEGPTSQPGNEEPHYQEPGPKDSQPVAEGTGRPGRSGWCSPTGGCVTGSVVKGPQVIPASEYSTPQTRSQLPSWATDPCPDCTSRGGGGGYSGYDPRNEGDGDVGGGGGRETPM